MSAYALVENGLVSNVIEWDGNESTWTPPAGTVAAEVTLATGTPVIGLSYVNGVFGQPVQSTPTPTVAQQAVSALASGLVISSTGTPALNGTYAVDPLTQMDIIAIETSLNAGKGFPGGATAFNYADMSGVMHSFTQANFTDFAAAVRDYVYGLKAVIAGASSTLPASSATIA